jgi:hypothetical protein
MGQRNPFALISQPRSCRDRHYTEINLCDQATPDHRKEDFTLIENEKPPFRFSRNALRRKRFLKATLPDILRPGR